ncbi:MAG: IclR family transcriptional regulator [Anaerolineaceae bacterium]|nr:IclR family transcriptional regulator [Anaerolineaceae bacterium]
MGKVVQTIERAFNIIELLGNADYHLGISEIAQRSNLPIATTHRLLNTLLTLGYVEQNPETNKYTLGVRILQLRGAVIEQLNLGVQAMPIMKMLMDRVGETVHLAVLNEGEIVYIERVEGLRTQGMYTRIGKRVPAHCTALGKVLLANLPEQIWYDDVIRRRGLKAFSETTITNEEDLMVELEATRQRGYAIDNGETGECVRCVATTIHDYTGQAVAAISISGPQKQVTVERVPELGEAVRWAAELISNKLGYMDS